VSEKSQFVQALLEYEKHKREIGEIQLPVGSLHQPSSVEKEVCVLFFIFSLSPLLLFDFIHVYEKVIFL
jgi:hypothetical protein